MARFGFYIGTAWLLVIALACELNVGGGDGAGAGGRGQGGRAKTVEVHRFSALKAEAFNFNTDVPEMIAVSDGVFYSALSTSMNLHAWKIASGNVAMSWAKLDDFEGSHAVARYNLNNGTRVIQRLAPVKGGVAVAVSDDTSAPRGAPASISGVAIFSGLTKKASASATLNKAGYGNRFVVEDMTEVVSENGERTVYLVTRGVQTGMGGAPPSPRNYVAWLNLNRLTNEVYGGGAPLRYPGPPLTMLDFADRGIGAVHAFSDHRAVIARPDGLLTVDKNSVGQPDTTPALLEQKRATDVLDDKHKDQFIPSGGKAPVKIGGMALVDKKYLVLGFVDNATDNGGFVSADISKPSFAFSSNLTVANAKVKKIVSGGDEARIITEDAIYGFHDGIFTLLYNSKKLTDDRARLNTGDDATNPNAPVDYDTYKGGVAGELPASDVKYFDAARNGDEGEWYYATDKGVYSVTTVKESKTF